MEGTVRGDGALISGLGVDVRNQDWNMCWKELFEERGQTSNGCSQDKVIHEASMLLKFKSLTLRFMQSGDLSVNDNDTMAFMVADGCRKHALKPCLGTLK